jgi:hypothetical protein
MILGDVVITLPFGCAHRPDGVRPWWFRTPLLKARKGDRLLGSPAIDNRAHENAVALLPEL